MEALWPLLVYGVAVLLIVAVMIGLSHVLGERGRANPSRDAPFESGVLSTGTARVRFSSHFYLVAMIFIIFELESVFFFAWAIAARPLGWNGFAGIAVFTFILAVGLLYEWRQGALDWNPSRRAVARGAPGAAETSAGDGGWEPASQDPAAAGEVR